MSKDLGFDFSREQYLETAAILGGIDALYEQYFDLQYEMLKTLDPAVVGHFDLVRLFDDNYASTMKTPAIWQKIVRNFRVYQTTGHCNGLQSQGPVQGQQRALYICPYSCPC